MTSKFVRFLFVGGIGFIVDAGGTLLLTQLGVSPILARVPSLLAAILVTWLFNRRLTFRVERPRSRAELMRYLTVAASSAGLNFLLYSAMVVVGIYPVVAVAVATVVLLLYSFFAYQHVVFR